MDGFAAKLAERKRYKLDPRFLGLNADRWNKLAAKCSVLSGRDGQNSSVVDFGPQAAARIVRENRIHCPNLQSCSEQPFAPNIERYCCTNEINLNYAF